MLVSIRAGVVTLCLLAAVACASRPTTSASAVDDAPRVLGACCPETDAGIYALMQTYESTPDAARPPELAILPYRLSSGLTQRERIVVRDAESWAALWPRIMGSHRPLHTLPPVNFSREMLVVASVGTRPSGGHTITIDSVSGGRDRLFVFLSERSPGPRCGVTAALSEPVTLARLVRNELPVSFVTRSVLRDC